MTRKSAARRFVQLHVLTLMTALAAVALLNAIVDPFDYFRPSFNGTLDRHKKRSASRYARPNVVASGDWDVIFCGASRTEIGLDPRHPAFSGLRVYNFGITGAKYPEIWWAAKFALECNPGLQTLWIELDPSYLVHHPLNEDFLNGRYGPRKEPFNYALGQLLGSLTTERSISALSKWHEQERADDHFTPLGLRVRPIRPPNSTPWDWFESELVQTRLRRDAQVAAHRADCDDSDAPWLDLSFLDSFPELVEIARQEQTQVCVIVPPSHVVRMAQFIDEGWYAQVNEFKRRLARLAGESSMLDDGRPSLVAYDFLVDDEANAEPLPQVPGADTRWHWEAGHFRVELGNRMIELVASNQNVTPGSFGAELTPETIDRHLTAANFALARRMPTVALVQEHMGSEHLVQRLVKAQHHLLATEPTGRIMR